MAPHAAPSPPSSSSDDSLDPQSFIPYFGTKSVYPPHPPGAAGAVRPPPNSKLVHVSLIARHGTRHPTRRGLDRMLDLEAFLVASAPNLPWLSGWSHILRVYEANEGCLTPEGEAEMRAIGERFHKRYARLLTAHSYIAISSSKQRAVDSATAFLTGYGETHQALNRSCTTSTITVDPNSIPLSNDEVVRYTERHTGYRDFSMRHKKAVQATLTSGRTKRAGDIAERIARDLGIPSLRPEFIRVIAEAAAFDYAHGRRASPLVRLLEPRDSAFLEAFDRAYRPVFEGCTRFRALAAPLIRALVDTLLQAKVGAAPVADLKFAHAQTLVPLLILLGVKGNGLCPRRGDFRPGLSGLCPFAANLCVELFEVDSACQQQMGGRFLVRFRLHERYIACVPALGEHGRDGIVPLERLLDFLQDILEEDDGHQDQQKSRMGAKGHSGVLSGGHGHASLVSPVVTVPAPAQVVE